MHDNRFMNGVIKDLVSDHLMSTKQLKNIIRVEKLIPIGNWAGIFGMTFEDLQIAFPSIRIPLSAYMGISPNSFDELVDKCVNEMDEFRTCLNITRIYAIKIRNTYLKNIARIYAIIIPQCFSM